MVFVLLRNKSACKLQDVSLLMCALRRRPTSRFASVDRIVNKREELRNP